jgi:hypothetical protein
VEVGSRIVPITTNLRRPFSRYLLPPQRAPRKSSGRLRALVLIANPRISDDAPFSEIDVPAQRNAIATEFDSETDPVYLIGANASRTKLLEELRKGPDIVYIVCHGRLRNDVPVLLLEQPDKQAEITDCRLIFEAIRGDDVLPPQLIAFGSCESAGGDAKGGWDGGALSSVAALMIAAGVAAVVGMQGKCSQDTSLRFLPAFFRELFIEGQVERAVTQGRLSVRDMTDWWMPVLLLSRDGGQIWPPKLARQVFRGWESLLDAIGAGQCTPILGSEVLAPFSNREFAKALLAEMPDQLGAVPDELAWIAQQFQIFSAVSTIQPRFDTFIRSRVLKDGICEEEQDDPPQQGLQEYLRRWAKSEASQKHLHILNDLADLPFSKYVTTNADELLENALEQRGRIPISVVCPWTDNMREVQSQDLELAGRVTRKTPLVYHLFGALAGNGRKESTVVLTEDEFFQHLFWFAGNRNMIPKMITGALSSTSLLFLGFHLQDWEFRILLRCLTLIQSSDLLSSKTHVAVQLPLGGDPDKQRQAQEQLQQYFKLTRIRLSIFYGTAEEFSSELVRRWLIRKGAH